MSRPTLTAPRLGYRYAELPARLRCSIATVKRRAARRDLPTVHLSERLRIVPADGLARLLGTPPLELEGDALLSAPAVARCLGISGAQAHRLIRGGRIPSVPWGSGRRTPIGKLHGWLTERTEGGGS